MVVQAPLAIIIGTDDWGQSQYFIGARRIFFYLVNHLTTLSHCGFHYVSLLWGNITWLVPLIWPCQHLHMITPLWHRKSTLLPSPWGSDISVHSSIFLMYIFLIYFSNVSLFEHTVSSTLLSDSACNSSAHTLLFQVKWNMMVIQNFITWQTYKATFLHHWWPFSF